MDGVFLIKTPVVSWIDYPDDESLAVVWYFTGCGHNCLNCQNKDLQMFMAPGSEYFTIEKFFSLTHYYCERNRTNKVVLEGGDPLFETNIEFVRDVLFSNASFDICIYTGYDIEYVKKNRIKGFTYLKTGKYEESLKQVSEKTDDYMSLATSNQKIYDKDYNLLSKNGKIYWRDLCSSIQG